MLRPYKKNYLMIESILWDFDGVILDSMPIRDQGFIEVLKEFPEKHVNELLAYHRRNGGLSRYVKFRYFFEGILGEEVTEKEVLKMASDFSLIMQELLIDDNLLIEDSLKFIMRFFDQVPMHIVSGSDGQELNFLCQKLDITKYFKTINGSPTPKVTLVDQLLSENTYRSEKVFLIGDSQNDFEAAKKNNIHFLAYNNSELRFRHTYISSLGELDLSDIEAFINE